ncbi:MAG: ATP-dependent metallopeptidase FtsH/Yme1/Tma family protein [Clostridiaceae bacterium]|nr:ATP-dependent metallopeptidase FtsH/Yme1/Tma family protein [Clostridiaceae bacterium]
MKRFRGASFPIIIFVIIALVIMVYGNLNSPTVMKYSDFRKELDEGNVKNIIVKTLDADVILEKASGKFLADYRYNISFLSQESFINLLDKAFDEGKISDYTIEKKSTPPWWLELFPVFAMVILFVFFWVFFIQQSQGGSGNRVMSFGKSRARMANEDKMKKRFSDVAGADEEKEELEEIVEFLKEPKKYVELGARIPKGVLLVGPPGTGKTLLAKAVAGEAGTPFFSISGSDFVEMFVGVGASRVRDLFEQAKKNAPSIVFIDEIDAVGRHRGAGLGGGHDEREQTLNQLLVEMDGFGVNEGVIILAATNRPDILDPALMRPGRFDRQIVVNYPDIKGREEILMVHSKNKPLSDDVDLKDVAKTTPGFTGADLENLLNEAALLAARRNLKEITMAEIKEANYKVVMGPEKKSRVISDKEKKLTAYHEAGHAITIRVISSTDKVDRVTIIPSGRGAGGFTSYKPDEDRHYTTKGQLIEQIVVSLGGRAAEELMLGEISTGAFSDLKKANTTARNMITKYGMSDNLSNLVFGDENDEVFIGKSYAHARNYSEEVSAKIDAEVKEIIESCYNKAKEILTEHKDKLEDVTRALLEKERIEADEFEDIFKNGYNPSADEIPSEENPAGDKPSEDALEGDSSAENKPAEDTPTGEIPAEDTQLEETPSEETPSEETPSEE